MNKIIVKKAPKEFNDWNGLLNLLQTAFEYQTTRIDPPSSLTRMDAQALEEKAQKEILLLAFLEEELVGCLFAKSLEEKLYLGKFAVSPAHQGKGIGKKLMHWTEELAKEFGYSLLELETRVELIENHQTFARFGFIKTSENAHAGYGRPTSIVMQKAL